MSVPVFDPIRWYCLSYHLPPVEPAFDGTIRVVEYETTAAGRIEPKPWPEVTHRTVLSAYSRDEAIARLKHLLERAGYVTYRHIGGSYDGHMQASSAIMRLIDCEPCLPPSGITRAGEALVAQQEGVPA